MKCIETNWIWIESELNPNWKQIIFNWWDEKYLCPQDTIRSFCINKYSHRFRAKVHHIIWLFTYYSYAIGRIRFNACIFVIEYYSIYLQIVSLLFITASVFFILSVWCIQFFHYSSLLEVTDLSWQSQVVTQRICIWHLWCYLLHVLSIIHWFTKKVLRNLKIHSNDNGNWYKKINMVSVDVFISQYPIKIVFALKFYGGYCLHYKEKTKRFGILAYNCKYGSVLF